MTKRTWTVFSIITDLITVNLAIIAAFYVRFFGHPPDINFNAYTKLAIFITIIYFSAAYLSSIYTIEELVSSGFFEPVIKAVTISWLVMGGFIWFSQAFSFPRAVFVLSWSIAVVSIFALRSFSINVLSVNLPKQRILIVGTKPIAAEIISKLKSHHPANYEVVGLIADDNKKTYSGVNILGKNSEIPSLVTEHLINRIIITSPLKSSILEQIAALGLPKLKIEVVPDLYEILVGKVDYNTLTDIPLLELTKSDIKSTYRVSKRLIDISLAGLGLLITGPLVILPASIIIKLTSKGPAFYRQERVGFGEKVFSLVKLRTMRQDAEKSTGPVLAKKNDDRVTSVGKILRKYRLDELPQLVNIFRGEMSFVGPRPERPAFVTKFKKEIPGYASRFRLKPGATGLAQISGSYATDAQNKLKFDLFYLYHRSFWLDMKIIFKTIRVMISGTGSH